MKSEGLHLSCPIPLQDYPQVLLAHGGGGKLMSQLIEKLFLPAFANPWLDQQHDGAVVELDGVRVAFSTDSYVVDPLFFPGGDIGALAVNGTVNDLAMCGAQARFLSVAFIIEEGLSMEVLWQVTQSMQRAARETGVVLVTGDTKVVDRGKGDKLFINTAGVGVVGQRIRVAPDRLRAGDAVLVSGDLGRHGIAIMAQREGLVFESVVESDCAPLVEPVMALLKAGIEVHCLRDLTRGGLASALVEIAECTGRQIEIEERRIPVGEQVKGACELLGLDPLYVANEGRFVAFVAQTHAEMALEILHACPVASGAVCIGQVSTERSAMVLLESLIGVRRIVDRLSGEQLPRIC